MSYREVDILNMCYHSLAHALKTGTVPAYSSTSSSGGSEQTMGEIIPGIVIGPRELDKTRRAILEGNTPYCVFKHRNSADGPSLYGGVTDDSLFWEINGFVGSGGLSKKNALEGWLVNFLRKRRIPVYEFLYNSGTNQVVKSSQVIAYMRVQSLTALDAAEVTGLESEEGRVIVNFTTTLRKEGRG